MIQKTIQQFVHAVEWGELDYLLVDLPPGTGDAQLSLCQTVPLDGGVIVTTPQEASLGVVRKGIAMFEKVNVPLLGIIENMSYFTAPNGERIEIFGHGGGGWKRSGRRWHSSVRCRFSRRYVRGGIEACRWWFPNLTARRRRPFWPSAARCRNGLRPPDPLGLPAAFFNCRLLPPGRPAKPTSRRPSNNLDRSRCAVRSLRG